MNAVAQDPPEGRQDFLRLEYATLEKLQEREAPTVAVADGLAFGAGAGVFMACKERVVTERSRLAMPECRIGIVPDAGALRFLTKHCEPAVARYLMLTGAPLNAHDLYKTGLATRYVPDKEDLGLEQLYAELSSAPAGEVTTPLDRRGVEAPRRLESGLFNDVTLQAVRDAFGSGASIASIRDDLELCREAAKSYQGSSGWATREAADGVLDVLDAAADGLSRGCPTALDITLDAVDRLASRKDDAEPASSRYGRRVELAANARLGAAPDFAEGVACVVGARRGERAKWSNDASLVGVVRNAVDGLADDATLEDVVRDARCLSHVNKLYQFVTRYMSFDRDRRAASVGGPMLPVGRYATSRRSLSRAPMPPFASARSTRSRPSTPTTNRSARVRSAFASARSARSTSAPRSRAACRASRAAFRSVCAASSLFSAASSRSRSDMLASRGLGGGGGGFWRRGGAGSRRPCFQSSTGGFRFGGGGGLARGGGGLTRGGGGLARGGGGAAARTAVGGCTLLARRGAGVVLGRRTAVGGCALLVRRGAGVALGRRRRVGNAASSMSWRRAMSMAGRLAVRARCGAADARRAGVGTGSGGPPPSESSESLQPECRDDGDVAAWPSAATASSIDVLKPDIRLRLLIRVLLSCCQGVQDGCTFGTRSDGVV